MADDQTDGPDPRVDELAQALHPGNRWPDDISDGARALNRAWARDTLPRLDALRAPARPAERPTVKGRCPNCGHLTLFLTDGGHVTCTASDCDAPDMVDDLLAYAQRWGDRVRSIRLARPDSDLPDALTLAAELRRQLGDTTRTGQEPQAARALDAIDTIRGKASLGRPADDLGVCTAYPAAMKALRDALTHARDIGALTPAEWQCYAMVPVGQGDEASAEFLAARGGALADAVVTPTDQGPDQRLAEAPAERTHERKTWPGFFQAIVDGRKTFELRVDGDDERDEEFREGDDLLLREWDPDTEDGYTGRSVRRRVTYVLSGGAFGLAYGHVAMGLRALAPTAPGLTREQEAGR